MRGLFQKLRKHLYILLVVLVGLSLLAGGFIVDRRERESRLGLRSYNEACEKLSAGDPAKAVELFFEVGLYTQDKELRAKTLYNLGTFAWKAGADAQAIIDFYQSSLREYPGVLGADPDLREEEAGWNLELLYDLLREIEAGGQPVPGEGEEEGEESGTRGDI